MLRLVFRIGAALLSLLVVAFAAFAIYVDLPAQVRAFTSMTAKLMCSTVFVAGRDEKDVWEQDFKRPSWPNNAAELARLKVDYETKSVISTLMGFGYGKAIYREGIGCTALIGLTEEEVRAQGEGVATTLPPPDPNVLWPEGDAALSDLPANVDGAKLAAAFAKAFAEPDPEKPRKTREVVVVYKGRIIAERYAPGFTTGTALISQSMALGPHLPPRDDEQRCRRHRRDAC